MNSHGSFTESLKSIIINHVHNHDKAHLKQTGAPKGNPSGRTENSTTDKKDLKLSVWSSNLWERKCYPLTTSIVVDLDCESIISE